MVEPINDAPVAVNDLSYTNQNTPVSFNITTNDTDVDGTINAATVDLDPTTAGIQTSYTVTNEGTYTVNSSGLVTFTPVSTFTGTTTPIYYTVNDNLGLVSNQGIITISVLAAGAPVATNDATSTTEDNSVTINISTNDNATSPAVIDPTSVDLNPSVSGIQTTYSDANGSWSVNASGVVTYVPTLNYNGTTVIYYTIDDDNGTTSNIASITIVVSPVNDAPSFTKGANQTVCSNVGVQTISNWATALSVGPSNESSQVISFSVTNNNNSLFATQPSVDAAGSLVFEPALAASGVATVSVKAKDNGGVANGGIDSSAVQTFTITINSTPTIASVSSNERCGTGTVSLQASASAGSVNWYTASTGGSSIHTGTSYTTPSIAATTTY